jgi:C4-dicarboxylate-specific signal transduction histidine kinase
VRSRRLRLLLLLDVAAIGAAGAALVLAVGLPLAARGRLRPAEVALLAAGVALAGVALGGVLLWRWVGRPVSRILGAAEDLGAAAVGELPLLAPPGEGDGHGLSRAAITFERAGAALAGERARLAEKVAELERANEALVQARESLLRADRLATLGQLASGIAHEVGNPLGAITGYVELARARLREAGPSEARRPSSREEVEDFLARVGAEAGRIDAIVRDLLDFARPAPPALGPVDLPAVVDAAARLARVQARFREVAVEVDLARVPPVLADERRLAQVFLNLFLNAGDAMCGRGRVTVSARPVSAPSGPRVEVRVEDTGPGIAKEHLGRVFEPFFTTKEPGQGTGLGLAVCHGIVTSFGGDISAAAGPGGGAAFRIELRAAPAEDP